MEISPLSFKVNATLSVQRIVAQLTGTANTVKLPASTAEEPIGVTLDDVKDTTTAIPVFTHGRAKVLFNDTVTSGADVGADSSGRAVPVTANTAGVWRIGTLVDADVAATGTIAEILINPAFLSSG